MRSERGAVAILVILALPALLAMIALVVGLGSVVLAYYQAHIAADLGALAGVQSLDLDQLAEGKIWIDPEEARGQAEKIAWENLRANFAGLRRAEVEITVEVYQASESEPLYHRTTGRRLTAPTVAVQLAFQRRLPLVIYSRSIAIQARADASAVRRRQ
ncbi:MAG: pilus assembly protein TadG-related protein [Bacillota bacterium]